jgi:hypothetical protein
MNKIKIFASLLWLSFLSGCGPYWYKPDGKIFTTMPQGGTPGFELGWKHGCESGLSTQFGGAFFQSFYTFKKDPDIMSVNPDLEKIRRRYIKELPINWNDPEEVKKNLSDYKRIHPAAYAYCKHTILGTMQSSAMEPPLPGDTRWDPAKADIGNVYRIDARGDTRWSLW